MIRGTALFWALTLSACGVTLEDDVRFESFVCTNIETRDAVRTASFEVYRPTDNQTCADCYRGACRLVKQACRCGNFDSTSDVTLRTMFTGLTVKAEDVTSVCVRVVGYSGAPANPNDCRCQGLGVFDAEMCSGHVLPFRAGEGPLTLSTECRLDGREALDTCLGT